ncbi:MAG: hypothetical protein NTX85_03210 [Candidatus Nomurabacteria bacterium]|nr:hypothetical protein [Candidatus Nomurabacteria bacterium]MCX6788461.1 hypothetical protein [Candidatus Jorgensenbacteria bacterium]
MTYKENATEEVKEKIWRTQFDLDFLISGIAVLEDEQKPIFKEADDARIVWEEAEKSNDTTKAFRDKKKELHADYQKKSSRNANYDATLSEMRGRIKTYQESLKGLNRKIEFLATYEK